jgi:hypothetical protein
VSRGARVAAVAVAITLGAVPAARAEVAVSARPSALALGATAGDVLVRDIVIRGDAAAAAWTIEVAPLTTPQGEQQAIDAITAGEVTVRGGRRLRVTVTVGDAEPGAYAGDVTVRTTAGVLVSVPVTCTVKSEPVLPIVLLVVGIVVGGVMSWYRGRGLGRDEVRARIGELRRRLPAGLPARFRVGIDDRIAEAVAALARKWSPTSISDATTAITAAEAALARYLAQPADWTHQMTFADGIVRSLVAAPAVGTAVHRDALIADVERRALAAPFAADAAALATQLAEVHPRARRYLRIDRLLAELAADPAQAAAVARWREAVDGAAITADARLDAIEAELIAALDVPPDALAELVQVDPAKRLPAVPESPAAQVAAGAWAARRLRVFGLVGNVAWLGLLFAVGYHQLYAEQPTFGGFFPHVSLLVWGLASELSRGAVAGLIKQAGFPTPPGGAQGG